ncbi:hypothetical protein L2E82_11709 [Cichorium intybus]|uniref:Uncharacterized protein n=1 Tax=Cichorium intybus TaxID=13427 RepID=A0ACB9GDY3_CICIN|nr:hypothetical protein L2E82_11709 [Cichorium intybus]
MLQPSSLLLLAPPPFPPSLLASPLPSSTPSRSTHTNSATPSATRDYKLFFGLLTQDALCGFEEKYQLKKEIAENVNSGLVSLNQYKNSI